jgi:hypothetical protein
VVREFPV